MARTAVEDEIIETMDPDIATEAVAETSGYKMAAGMSVPVPKKFGPMWQKRVEDGAKVYETEHALWDHVMRMYRETAVEENPADPIQQEYRYRMKNSTDENIIRTNLRTIMRTTYMRNPNIEFTSASAESDPQTEVLQHTMDFLLNKKTAPGLNMKNKARRWILHGQLTNHGIIRLDFQEKEGSLDEAREMLQEVESQLAEAKSVSEIRQHTAQLQLLYENMPLLEMRGMKVSNVLPHMVIVDPDCTSIDLSDANWLAEYFDMDTEYMCQKYYGEDEEGEKIRLSDGKQVDKESASDRETTEREVLAIVDSAQSDERRRYRQKNTTQCCYVYDKLTRRRYLFNTDDWSYPLWVYEDDLNLSRFFRHFILSFTETVDSIVQPGEPSFYMGQVNEINRINRKAKEIRDSAFGAIWYDKDGIDVEEVKRFIAHLRNPNAVEAFGIKKATDKKINEVLNVFVPPAFDYQALFNTNSLRSAIDKASAMSDIDRGDQFKTNTTNDAVQYYAENKQQATGQLIECIEDAFESLGWAMSELIVSKYSKEDIQQLLGPKWAEMFTPMTVEEFNKTYRMTLAAGSIEKPNTEFKKKEAITIAQSLGQFAQAVPATATRLVIRMFETAFSNFLVKKEDWDTLKAEGEANLQKGLSTQNGQTAPTNQPQ